MPKSDEPGARPLRIFIAANISALLLCVATWTVFVGIGHYREVGGELLVNGDFSRGMSGWLFRNVAPPVDGRLVITSTDHETPHVVEQILDPSPSGYIRVSVRGVLSGVVAGPAGWHLARVDVIGHRRGGDWAGGSPLKIWTGTGTGALDDVSGVAFLPSSRFDRIKVSCELTGATGQFVVDGVSAIPVEPRPLIGALKQAVMVGWVVLGVLVSFALLGFGGWRVALVPVSGAALLLFVPDAPRLVVHDFVESITSDLSLDHLVLFTGLSAALLYKTLQYPWKSAIYRVIGLLTLAICLEFVQYYLPGRTPEVVDFLSNVVGICLGAVSVTLFARLGRAS